MNRTVTNFKMALRRGFTAGARRPRVVQILVGLAAVSLHPSALSAQQDATPERLMADVSVSTGTLSNGLRYYVRRNGYPAGRAELRLVVHAGAGLEDSTQRGLAHFVEHMAFSGTSHFRKGEIVRYLESVGMQFGADVNAATTYDATIYRITLPTDRPDAVLTGVRILADWAHGITFDSAAVQAERGIILGEWRSRTDAGGTASRIHDLFLAQLLRGSRYVDRPPIGSPRIIETAARSDLVRFYLDWYRPDEMAVIVVGDVDVRRTEATIRRELGAIPRVAGGRKRPALEVPPWTSPATIVRVDSDAAGASVAVAYRLPDPERGTVRGFRERLVQRMLADVLSQRLEDGHDGTINIEEPMRDLRAYVLRASTGDGNAHTALAHMLGLVHQLAEHGVTPEELARVRAYTLRQYADLYARRAWLSSSTVADELEAEALSGLVMLDPATALTTAERVLNGSGAITLSDLNTAARAILGQRGRVVFVLAPPRAGAAVPSEQAIVQLVDSVSRASTPTLAGRIAPGPLVPRTPVSGRVDSVRVLPAIGAQEWVLSNGVHVIVKPTDVGADQILLEGIGPGGTSLAPDSDYVNAMLAAAVVQSSGLGDLSVSTLQLQLGTSAPSVVLTPFLAELNQGVTGRAARQDAKALLQLTYLAFTTSRLDSAAVERWRATTRAQLATGQADVAQKIQSVLTRNAPHGRPLTAAMIDSLDPRRALAFYRARFADASNFTFCLVGAFEPDSVRPLVERWIGGLPSTHAHETWRDLGVRPVPGPYTIDAPVSPYAKTTTFLYITGPMSFDAPENIVLNSLGQIAQRRLLERLRTAMHSTYDVQLSTIAARWPWPHHEIAVRFDAAPIQADSLAEIAVEVLDSLRAGGPTAREVADIKALEARRLEQGRRDNGYLLDMLINDVWNGWDYTTGITDVPTLLDVLTPERLRDAAARYLDTTHVVRIVIRPRSAES